MRVSFHFRRFIDISAKLLTAALLGLASLGVAGASDYVRLRSVQNGMYVRAGVGQYTRLAAVSPHVDTWETFKIHRYGGDVIALQSIQNGRFVAISANSGQLLAATAGSSGAAKFRVRDLGNGRVALQSVKTGRWVRAGIGKDGLLGATTDQLGSPPNWETFVMQSTPNACRWQTKFEPVLFTAARSTTTPTPIRYTGYLKTIEVTSPTSRNFAVLDVRNKDAAASMEFTGKSYGSTCASTDLGWVLPPLGELSPTKGKANRSFTACVNGVYWKQVHCDLQNCTYSAPDIHTVITYRECSCVNDPELAPCRD